MAGSNLFLSTRLASSFTLGSRQATPVLANGTGQPRPLRAGTLEVQVADRDTVASSGFVGIGFAENLAVALEHRFRQTATPRGLGAPPRK